MTKKQLAELAASFNATVEEERTDHWFEVRVEAPRGMKWSGDDVHEMVEQSCAGDAAWYAKARDEMAARLRNGLTPCDSLGCEWCNGI